MNSAQQRALLCPSPPRSRTLPCPGTSGSSYNPRGGGNSGALAVRSGSEGTAPEPTRRSPSDIHCQDTQVGGFPRLGVYEEEDQKGLSAPVWGPLTLPTILWTPELPCRLLRSGAGAQGRTHRHTAVHAPSRACSHRPPRGCSRSPHWPSITARVSGLWLKEPHIRSGLARTQPPPPPTLLRQWPACLLETGPAPSAGVTRVSVSWVGSALCGCVQQVRKNPSLVQL